MLCHIHFPLDPLLVIGTFPTCSSIIGFRVTLFWLFRKRGRTVFRWQVCFLLLCNGDRNAEGLEFQSQSLSGNSVSWRKIKATFRKLNSLPEAEDPMLAKSLITVSKGVQGSSLQASSVQRLFIAAKWRGSLWILWGNDSACRWKRFAPRVFTHQVAYPVHIALNLPGLLSMHGRHARLCPFWQMKRLNMGISTADGSIHVETTSERWQLLLVTSSLFSSMWFMWSTTLIICWQVWNEGYFRRS